MPGLRRRKLLTLRHGIFASPEYLQRMGTPETPDDLDSHFCIGYSANEPNNSLVVKGGKGFKDDHLEGVYMQTSVITQADCVELAEQGLGIINIGDPIFRLLNQERALNLVPILEDYWCGDMHAYAYYHQTSLEQPKVQAFLDFFFEKRAKWET